MELFNVGIVGDWHQRDNVIEFIDDHMPPGKTWRVAAEADTGYEHVTLNQVQHDARVKMRWVTDKRAMVLYAHTKGAAYTEGDHADRWRRVMTWHAV